MKRWIPLLLCAALLTGCGEQPSEVPQTEAAPVETTAPAEPGLYRAGSEVEAVTGGAVREYRVSSGRCTGLTPMGTAMLLLTTEKTTTATILQGENLTPELSVDLGCSLDLSAVTVEAEGNGFAYYNSQRKTMVFLDQNLEMTSETTLPEDMLGKPVLSPDWTAVYYCAADGIRALNLQNGLSRLLKETTVDGHFMLRLYCDGEILEYCGSGEGGTIVTVFLSTETGALQRSAQQPPNLTTQGNRYYLTSQVGTQKQLIFGELDGEAYRLYAAEAGDAVPLPQAHAYVLSAGEEAGCQLAYYDLESGKRTATVYVPELGNLWEVTKAGTGEMVYFRGSRSDPAVFYGWNLNASLTGDETVYTGGHYTAENPDTAGLARCQQEADRIGEAFGVEIRLWEAAAEVQPADYRITAEYQVAAYEKALVLLEDILGRFPREFFRTAAQGSDSLLRIGLVREVQRDSELINLTDVDGVQFWEDGDAYLVLEMGAAMERFFFHGMSHIIDNRVLGTGTIYDDWETLNPGDFSYDYDYVANQSREDVRYMEEDNRAFVDIYSMSFPKEDRARILEYGALPGNERYFTTDTMQAKLYRICYAIRETFGLWESPALPWEQYLREPMTAENTD